MSNSLILKLVSTISSRRRFCRGRSVRWGSKKLLTSAWSSQAELWNWNSGKRCAVPYLEGLRYRECGMSHRPYRKPTAFEQVGFDINSEVRGPLNWRIPSRTELCREKRGMSHEDINWKQGGDGLHGLGGVEDVLYVILVSTKHSHYPRPNLPLPQLKTRGATCGLSARTVREPRYNCLEGVAIFKGGLFPASSSGTR